MNRLNRQWIGAKAPEFVNESKPRPLSQGDRRALEAQRTAALRGAHVPTEDAVAEQFRAERLAKKRARTEKAAARVLAMQEFGRHLAHAAKEQAPQVDKGIAFWPGLAPSDPTSAT